MVRNLSNLWPHVVSRSIRSCTSLIPVQMARIQRMESDRRSVYKTLDQSITNHFLSTKEEVQRLTIAKQWKHNWQMPFHCLVSEFEPESPKLLFQRRPRSVASMWEILFESRRLPSSHHDPLSPFVVHPPVSRDKLIILTVVQFLNIFTWKVANFSSFDQKSRKYLAEKRSSCYAHIVYSPSRKRDHKLYRACHQWLLRTSTSHFNFFAN